MSKKDKSEALQEKLAILPETPGVYMYFDSDGTVIYIGKAKNLKRRVNSYFTKHHDVLRTNILVRNIADMKYIVVPTEQDALHDKGVQAPIQRTAERRQIVSVDCSHQ